MRGIKAIDLSHKHIGKVIEFSAPDENDPYSQGTVDVIGQLAAIVVQSCKPVGSMTLVLSGGLSFALSPDDARTKTMYVEIPTD